MKNIAGLFKRINLNSLNLDRNKALALFIISFLSLYFELIVIRWVSSEIRVFAFFKNIILIGSFLGLGLGCIIAGRKIKLFYLSIPMLAIISIILSLASHFGLSEIAVPTGDDFWVWWSSEGWLQKIIGSTGSALPFYFALFLLFIGIIYVLIVVFFISLGVKLGSLFDFFPPLKGYSINILGSILGIIVFTLLSFLEAPPFIWFTLGFFLLLGFFYLEKSCLAGYLTIGFIAMIAIFVGTYGTYWSPYYRIDVIPRLKEGENDRIIRAVDINHVYFQRMADLRPDFLEKNPGTVPEFVQFEYNIPYEFFRDPGDVLIVGSGAGNDVAAALRHGAKSVDAVEIDPVILELGKKLHPEDPYNDPRVRIINDDARSFFKKTNKKYDLIISGLLDSHTSLVSSLSNIRLDNYVYTLESFREMKNHLKDDGNFSLSFAAGKPWIESKIYSMLKEVFKKEPLVLKRGEDVLGAIYLVGNNLSPSLVNNNYPHLKDRVLNSEIEAGSFSPATDNWPYLYLKEHKIPFVYIISLLYILFISFISFFIFLGRRFSLMIIKNISNLHFFFLGAAFMLIETKSISELALLYGSTWLVNSIVILAILIMILISNLYVIKYPPRSLSLIYILLFFSLVVVYFFDFKAIAGLGFLTKAIIGGFFTVLPVLFAGIIFSYSFKRAKDVSAVFGANLSGVLLGGLLENYSMVFGIKAMNLLALFIYLLTIFTIRPLLANKGEV
jgi:hypothetical protein